MKVFIKVCLLLLVSSNSWGAGLSDQKIKNQIIAESINSYYGNCPCPYNLAKNGSRCGGRSAYSRAGGESPLCYESDVTKEMITEYKLRNGSSVSF